MTHPMRSFIALSILAIVLVACGTSGGAPSSEAPSPSEPATSPSAEPSVIPSEEPSEPADEERESAGTITVAEMAFSGPGATIQETLDGGPDGELPSLVHGVLFRDTDGTIYLATSVSDAAEPTFDGPMLEVLNMDNEGDSWDMANAELLGLEEANGIVFNQNAQILGFVAIP